VILDNVTVDWASNWLHGLTSLQLRLEMSGLRAPKMHELLLIISHCPYLCNLEIGRSYDKNWKEGDTSSITSNITAKYLQSLSLNLAMSCSLRFLDLLDLPRMETLALFGGLRKNDTNDGIIRMVETLRRLLFFRTSGIHPHTLALGALQKNWEAADPPQLRIQVFDNMRCEDQRYSAEVACLDIIVPESGVSMRSKDDMQTSLMSLVTTLGLHQIEELRLEFRP
jgi:hypothetical protein